MSENLTTPLIKTNQSPALNRVSSQLALIDKLLAKSEEPFLIPYRKGNKWGYCDGNKNIVIDCVYDRTYVFREGLACVELNQKMGFVNSIGQVVIDIYYDSPHFDAFDTLDEVVLFECHNHYGYFFSEGLACVRMDNKFGFVNIKG